MRDLVLKACLIAGTLLGFLWALHHQNVAPRRLCGSVAQVHERGVAGTRRLEHCLSSDLSSVLLAWIIPIGVGTIAGALVGLAFARMIRLGRTPTH